MSNNFVNLKPWRIEHHMKITIAEKYTFWQAQCDELISHVSMAKSAL